MGQPRSSLTEIAGKTGTAQVVGRRLQGVTARFNDHAWFAAFAPVDKPEITVVVLVEHGGHGGSEAAPVAKKIIEEYVKKSTIALFDWKAFTIIILIMVIGLSTIFSATYTSTPENATPLYLKQVGWIFIGIFFLLIGTSIDYQSIARYAYYLYAFSFLLLIVVLVAGKSGFGAQRWLAIGGFSFQPSELAKLATAFAITKYFSDYPARYGYNVRELLIPGVLIAIPVLLVLKQPDLGTGMVITFVSVVLILLVRIRSKLFGIMTLLMFMSFPFLWQIFWENLKEYQKTRLPDVCKSFGRPYGNRVSYNTIQDCNRIRRFFGKGDSSEYAKPVELSPCQTH